MMKMKLKEKPESSLLFPEYKLNNDKAKSAILISGIPPLGGIPDEPSPPAVCTPAERLDRQVG